MSSFIKIRPMGDESFHADRKDITKLIAVFRNFVKTPKKCQGYEHQQCHKFQQWCVCKQHSVFPKSNDIIWRNAFWNVGEM